jgi:PRTRC genetic system protein F
LNRHSLYKWLSFRSASTTEEKIEVQVSNVSHLEILKLKPVIEGLNQQKAGLGWFVYDVIARADSHRYPIYSPGYMASMAEQVWFQGENTDDDVAEQYRGYDAEDATKTVAELKEMYSHPWPSDLIDAVEGHAWMLCWGYARKTETSAKTKRPKPCSFRAAKQFAKDPSASKEAKAVVQDALDLIKEIDRKDSRLPNATGAPFEEGYDEYQPIIGASCFLVWNEGEVFLDAAEHFEEDNMNSGEGTEVVYQITADPNVKDQVTELIKTTQDIVIRHAAISRLLRHFPKER